MFTGSEEVQKGPENRQFCVASALSPAIDFWRAASLADAAAARRDKALGRTVSTALPLPCDSLSCQKKNRADAEMDRPNSGRAMTTPDAGTAPSEMPVMARSFSTLLALMLSSTRSIGRAWANSPTVV